MITKLLGSIVIYYPNEKKKFRKKESKELYSAIILAADDSIDNYEEVDELWTPGQTEKPEEPEEKIDIIPDEEGRISYDDAQRLLNSINVMKDRMTSLQESNDLLTECILEVSEMVYNG